MPLSQLPALPAPPALWDLCAPLDRHLAVPAILAGETPARIMVDDPHAPAVALLLPWDHHRAYLAGAPRDPAQLAASRATLALELFAWPTPYSYILNTADPAWEAALPDLCAGMETRSLMRQCYTITPDAAPQPSPADWTIRPVDAALLAEPDLAGLPDLVTEMGSESPSEADFLTRNFGFVAQVGRRLIGWCLSEYNHGDRCEVGIETVAEYQRRGVGFSLASALLAHAAAQGITQVGWHCRRDNTASAALARKLGGTLAAEYATVLCRKAA